MISLTFEFISDFPQKVVKNMLGGQR